MATAPPPLASCIEKTNGAKLSRLLIDGGKTVLKKVFDGHHPPAKLAANLNTNYSLFADLHYEKILNSDQWGKLFPPGGATPDSNTFDISLLFLLLTNICGLSPPRTGWHNKPHAKDKSLQANLARVKFYRNTLAHVTTTGVDKPTFSALWKDISAPLLSLGLDQGAINRLKEEKGGEEEYLKLLRDWFDRDEQIKSQLKSIHQSQTKTYNAVEELRQTQMEDHEILHNSNVRLEEAAKEAAKESVKTHQEHETLQVRLQELKEAVDSLKEAKMQQAKTRQTIEEVAAGLQELQEAVDSLKEAKMKQTIEEVATGLQELKEKVDSLKEARDKAGENEVLQKLAKSEFRGDIEYYMERFQADTREWVFERVQNWLDDRSSQNRVMVISGIAGMGKTVIAAVFCKRMQEAGRLSGSHFCQHDNPRYCRPQLMLQSLACHLSYALPEYKQALVEQLSRNLGKDLNNMGVEELFALLFKEPLSAVGDPGRNMVTVIDGLDEIEYQDEGRNKLLDVIANQFCKLPTWIRFLVTTRPAMNIAEKLKHFKPFELQCNDEKNLEDIRTVLEKKLQHVHVVKAENEDDLVEKLVLKSEGLMLYAHFLILFIAENPSVLNQEDLDGSLPLGISSVYHSYFKRAESELMKELDIKEEHFLNLLCALIASREPLPVGFVSKVLVPSTNSPLAKRNVLKALGSVSALLPIRDGCLHIIHKSVKDWLAHISCYGEHEFIMDENEGHRVLAHLCTGELDDLKRRGINNEQFSATEKYALYHGARHILHSYVEMRPQKLNELTKAYVIDLEQVYAKTCVNSTTTADDLVWLQKQGISAVLSEECQDILNTLLFLLRKYLHIFTNHPRMFLQTMLNQGGIVLSAEASNLLKNKYREISYMECISKDVQQRDVVAGFYCSSQVACLDVSPESDYMVCECKDGMLQLWSLHTGRLMWTRPVKVAKKFYDKDFSAYRQIHSLSVCSFYRSVAFHPTEDVVLPGILSHVYTIDGDLKPLFLESNCRFSVCSIAGDKTKILTDCLDNPKCLVMWSLENGSEIACVTRNEDILSFALSRDGRLLAISHPNGLICLVDVMDGSRTLAQTTTSYECGMLKFSPDHQFIFCLVTQLPFTTYWRLIRLNVNTKKLSAFSLDVCSDQVSYDYRECEYFSDCGFPLGDLIPQTCGDSIEPVMHFLLNEQSQLKAISERVIMLNTNEVRENSQDGGVYGNEIALSLDGQTVYVISDEPVFTFMAWDVSSGELIAEINNGTAFIRCLVPVRGGVLFTSDGTPELWKCDLSECVQRWTNLSGITKVIYISEERAACIEEVEVNGDTTSSKTVNVLDTTSGKIVSTIPVLHGIVIACNSKCHLLTSDDAGSLQLSDGRTVLWEKNCLHFNQYDGGVFSPVEQFLCVFGFRDMCVLDALSGNTLHAFSAKNVCCCKFVSDEECVFSFIDNCSLQLFNVRSGDTLSQIIEKDMVVSGVGLAVCPRNHRLLAICVYDSTPCFKVIQVRCGAVKTTGRAKGMNKAPEIAEQSRK